MKYTAFSIGHSNLAFSEFLKKLKDNKIEILVDVRSLPKSRFCPHFNEKRLATALKEHNISYLFKGGNLGGRGENTDYEETIDELVVRIKGGDKICVMCSEKDYMKCHRFSDLTPSFEARSVNVKHIG